MRGDPEAVLDERRARPSPCLETAPEFQKVIALASDDAVRMGQRFVRVETLLSGVSCAGGGAQYWIARNGGMDFNAFLDAVFDRVWHGDDRVNEPLLQLDPEAKAVIAAAVDQAAPRDDGTANGMHLLPLLNHAGGALEQLLTRFGGSVKQMKFMLDSRLQYDSAVSRCARRLRHAHVLCSLDPIKISDQDLRSRSLTP